MEQLKKPQELVEPDPRNHAFVVLDQAVAGGVRPSSAEDRYLEMEALDLPQHIPVDIASAFAVARNLWMYGWFHWPFYALAGFQAHRCIEAALRRRYEREQSTKGLAGKKGPPLKALLRTAIDKGWIRDDGFEHYRRLEAQRRKQEESLGELGWLPGDAPIRSPTQYSEILARNIPYLRNQHAHGDGPLALLFNQTRLDLELARDVILQVIVADDKEAV